MARSGEQMEPGSGEDSHEGTTETGLSLVLKGA